MNGKLYLYEIKGFSSHFTVGVLSWKEWGNRAKRQG